MGQKPDDGTIRKARVNIRSFVPTRWRNNKVARRYYGLPLATLIVLGSSYAAAQAAQSWQNPTVSPVDEVTAVTASASSNNPQTDAQAAGSQSANPESSDPAGDKKDSSSHVSASISSSGAVDSSLTVNGQPVPIPDNGSASRHQVIDDGSKTIIDINVKNNDNSSTNVHSSTNIHIYSNSSSSSSDSESPGRHPARR